MSANIVSRETPSQDVPSFDHRVTQCISVVKVSAGNARNAFQSHRRKTLMPSSIVNSHRSRGTCGVGPADKTGKVAVRYCPGGSFPASALRRPEKPREMIAIAILPAERGTALSGANQCCRWREQAELSSNQSRRCHPTSERSLPRRTSVPSSILSSSGRQGSTTRPVQRGQGHDRKTARNVKRAADK